MTHEQGLTPKQKRFADEYLVDLNASAAYKRAGYRARGHVAEVDASRLLRKAKVSAYIAEKRQKMSEQLDIESRDALRENARIALSDIRKLFDERGCLKPIHELDPDAAAALASVEVEEIFEGKGKSRKHVGRLIKLKLWDKNSALDRLMKYFGLYEKDNRQKTDPVAELLRAIADRTKIVPRTQEGGR